MNASFKDYSWCKSTAGVNVECIKTLSEDVFSRVPVLCLCLSLKSVFDIVVFISPHVKNSLKKDGLPATCAKSIIQVHIKDTLPAFSLISKLFTYSLPPLSLDSTVLPLILCLHSLSISLSPHLALISPSNTDVNPNLDFQTLKGRQLMSCFGKRNLMKPVPSFLYFLVQIKNNNNKKK